MDSRWIRSAVAALLLVGLAAHTALSARRIPTREELAVTWKDAPPLAQRMKFTLNEAKQLFKDDERPRINYEQGMGLSNGQKTGEPFVTGVWKLTREDGIDRSFRSNPGGKPCNPQNLKVRSKYRYTPPKATSDFARLTIDVTAEANVSAGTSKRIQSVKEFRAKTYKDMIGLDADAPRRFIPDLGFGIERNDMHYSIVNRGGNASVNIYLADPRHFATVRIQVIMGLGAIEPKRTLDIARGVAIIMCNKIWGTNLRPPGVGTGSVGIADVWLTAQRGNTPEEDPHADRVKLGTTFYVAIAHRVPIGRPVRINVRFRPGQDAVAASAERARLIKEDFRGGVFGKPLDDGDIVSIQCPGAVGYDAEGVPLKGRSENADVKFGRLPNGTAVAYVPIYTEVEDARAFLKAPGSWQIDIQMVQVLEDRSTANGKVLTVSTAKANVIIGDNPTISRQYYNLPKKAE